MRVWLALACVWLFGLQAVNATERVDAAIVFVMDVSGSMDKDEVAFVRASHAAAITSPEMVGGIMAGYHGRIAAAYVEFGERARVRIGWTLIDNEASAHVFASTITGLGPAPNLGSSTSIVAGLNAAGAALLNAPPADKYVIDVVGDGKNTRGGSVIAARAHLVSRGVVINALALMRSPWDGDLDTYYAENVRGGPGSFSIPVTSLDQLPQALRSKVLLEIFRVPPSLSGALPMTLRYRVGAILALAVYAVTLATAGG